MSIYDEIQPWVGERKYDDKSQISFSITIKLQSYFAFNSNFHDTIF